MVHAPAPGAPYYAVDVSSIQTVTAPMPLTLDPYLYGGLGVRGHRDWNAPGHIKGDLRALNRLRREHPALQQLAQLEFVSSDNDALLCYRKWAGADQLLAVVNLDPARVQEASVQLGPGAFGLPHGTPLELEDLLSGARYTWYGEWHYVRLDPAQAPGHLLCVRNARAA